ncbi:MAG: hypothetical protein Q7T20_00200 [Saprospiraceae bacterium]|nr:hypothetical protein [Saprospiraceae bacterium]
MAEERSPFYAFRYFVSPSESPKHLFSDLERIETSKTKEELMHDVFSDLHKEHKTDFGHSNKRFLFYSFGAYKNRLFVFQFAKEETSRKSIEGPVSIQTIPDRSLKYVLMFVHPNYQILLVERKTTAFPNVDFIIRQLEWYFRDRMRHFGYTVNIHPLSRSEKFWEAVDNADFIYELSLTLNAPNIYFGDNDLREMLKEIKDDTNNDETVIEFKSVDGNLDIKKSVWQKWIDYISNVGGRYSLKTKKIGESVEKQTNYDNAEKAHVIKHKEKEYTDDELQDVEMKMKIIHDRAIDKEQKSDEK